MPRLPKQLYELSCIGRDALRDLEENPGQLAPGHTRSEFIFNLMEHARSMSISERAVKSLDSAKSKSRWRSRYSRTRGFCYTKLLAYQWIVPAICTLGAYPLAEDVLRLQAYFRPDLDVVSWALYETGTRQSKRVMHIKGMERRCSRTIIERLTAASGSRIGAQRQSGRGLVPQHTAFDRYYNPRPNSGRRHDGSPYPRGDRGRGRGQARGGHGIRDPRDIETEDFHRIYDDIGKPNWGQTRNNARRAGANAYFQTFNTGPDRRRQSSPSSKPQQWKRATHDDLDTLLENMKSECKSLPTQHGDGVWNDTLAWFQDAKQKQGFDRTTIIPELREYFASVFEPALRTAQEEAANVSQLESRGKELTDLFKKVSLLEKDLAEPPVGTDIAHVTALLAEARSRLKDLDAEVDMLEAEEVPPSVMDEDPIANGDSFIPLDPEAPPAKPWMWGNYENYGEIAAELFDAPITGKLPFEDLLVEMEVPLNSKILLPRPLEIYTQSEVNSAIPKGRAPWFNWHEDCLEPVKCWDLDTFKRVYSKPGYHFLVARVAQIYAQSKDPKLGKLRSMLADRWKCQVTFDMLDPRQDWMMCTIPDTTGPRAEILSASLMRLSDGNASYVIRHFRKLARSRDLIINIKNVTNDASSVYNQLKKRLLEFEASGVFLRWRILGVRKTGSPFQFRASFILEDSNVYWPWTHKFSHDHGSVNPSSPLLNFDPVWVARKPYSCQSCYSSVHATNECPLAHVTLGGTKVVGYTALQSLLNKKPAERMIIVDKSLMPDKNYLAEINRDLKAAPKPDATPEKRPSEDTTASKADLLCRFLMIKLHRQIADKKVSEDMIKSATRKGSMADAFERLAPVVNELSSMSPDVAIAEMNEWTTKETVPKSLVGGSPRSSDAVMGEASGQAAQPTITQAPAGERDLATNLPEMENESLFSAADMSAFDTLVTSNIVIPDAAHDHMAQSTPLSDMGPPLNPNWARDFAPRPDTVKEVDSAVAAILRGPVPDEFSAFQPVPPSDSDRPATAADFADAVGKLRAALPAPEETPASPISSWDPTQVSQSELELAAGLKALSTQFPDITTNFLLHILERSDGNAATASAWLTALEETEKLVNSMCDIFPDAGRREVKRLVNGTRGNPSLVWAKLSETYHSPWMDEFTSSAIKRKSSRSALLRDDESVEEEVIIASDGLKEYNRSWWDTYLSTRKFRISASSPHASDWDEICKVAACKSAQPKRFVGYIANLGGRTTNPTGFKTAIKFLRAMPEYSAACEQLLSRKSAALIILPMLLEDGLINTPGAAWLALNSTTSHDRLFISFINAHRHVRVANDKALRAHLDTNRALYSDDSDRAGAGNEVIDQDMGEDKEVDTVPEVTAKPARKSRGGSRTSAEKRVARRQLDLFGEPLKDLDKSPHKAGFLFGYSDSGKPVRRSARVPGARSAGSTKSKD